MARACAGCAPYVFACFKGMERFADWLTGAAGPVFIFLAVLLTGTGGFIFFEVVYPSTSSFLPPFLHLLFAIPCFVIALNLYGHYYLVCSVPPGRPDDGEGRGKQGNGWWPWAKPRKGAARVRELRRNEDAQEALMRGGAEGASSPAETREQQQPQEKKCRKCGGAKPERTHHCSVCKTCILRYDHHCPWINQCVGLRNERHFVLFMFYLVVSCTLFTTLGYPLFFPSLDLQSPWPYYTPRIAYTLLWVLALALGIAVSVMLSWHVLQASWGETSVEGHDNAYYAKRAKERGEVGRFESKWDLGRWRNLEVFMNVGEDGYGYHTLLLPYRILTHSDGRIWERRRGAREIADDEDLTDDEEGGGGWME